MRPRLFTARATDQMEAVHQGTGGAGEQAHQGFLPHESPVRGGGHGPVELRVELFANVVVPSALPCVWCIPTISAAFAT